MENSSDTDFKNTIKVVEYLDAIASLRQLSFRQFIFHCHHFLIKFRPN